MIGTDRRTVHYRNVSCVNDSSIAAHPHSTSLMAGSGRALPILAAIFDLDYKLYFRAGR